MLLDTLSQRAKENWLIGYDSQEFNHLTLQRFHPLTQNSTSLNILLAESHPVLFLASFLAAVAANCNVFLCNPNWVKSEWEQVFNLVSPDIIWGKIPNITPSATYNPQSTVPKILIPTGGSSGKIRFTIHTWETLEASVKGFSDYFGQKPVNSFCVLPLYHVSGLMQFLRSFLTGGRILIMSYSELKERKEFAFATQEKLNLSDFFISLVPTQLQYLLSHFGGELSQFKTILLGGAPAWEDLLHTARKYNLPLALTYGMTETASQVVTLQPQDFLAGNNSSGKVLPHAKVTICSETGEILPANEVGSITIQAKSLYLGYYGEESRESNFLTDDLGYFDSQCYLYVVGRNSNKIITGGENVYPSEVEAVILGTGLVKDVCVVGVADEKWGQVVTAVYVPNGNNIAEIQNRITGRLSKYKYPKHWVAVKQLPRNLQGKVNYEKVREIAKNALNEFFL